MGDFAITGQESKAEHRSHRGSLQEKKLVACVELASRNIDVVASRKCEVGSCASVALGRYSCDDITIIQVAQADSSEQATCITALRKDDDDIRKLTVNTYEGFTTTLARLRSCPPSTIQAVRL